MSVHMKFIFASKLIICSCCFVQGDLKEYVEAARNNNSEIRKARAEFNAFVEQENIVFANLLPSISARVSRSKVEQERSDSTRPKIKQNYITESDSLSLSQPLYRPRLLKDLENIRLLVDSEKLILEQKEELLVLKVANQYFDILDKQNKVDLIKKRIGLLEEQLEASKKTFLAGTGTITERAEVKSALDQAGAELIKNTQILKLAFSNLSLISGLDKVSTKELQYEEKEFEKFKVKNLKKWEEEALQRNFDTLSFQKRIEAAEAALSAERYNRYPTIDMSLQVARGSSESTFFVDSETTTKSVGITLSMPLYQGGSLSSRIRRSAETLNAEKEGLNFQREEIRRRVQNSFFGVVENFSLNDALETALESATIELEANKKSVTAGLRRRLDVLIAQQKAISIEQQLSAARIKIVLNWLQLNMLSGRLDEDKISKVSKILR